MNEKKHDDAQGMRLIHLYAPEDVVIFLVGNKSDLEHKRVVSREEAERYASSIGADYGEASARTGDEVDECMFRFTVRVMEKQAKSLSSQKRGGPGRRRDASTLSGSQLAEKNPVRRCNCF